MTTNTQVEELFDEIMQGYINRISVCIDDANIHKERYELTRLMLPIFDNLRDSLLSLFTNKLELAKIESNETRSIVTGVAKRLKQARELGRKYIRISDLEYSIRYELTKQKEELQK